MPRADLILTSNGSYAEITADAVISETNFLVAEADSVCNLNFGLYQGANAFGAQYLAHFATIFDDADRLQVRTKSSRGGFLRPRPILSKCRLFSTMSALCHNRIVPFKGKSYHRKPTGQRRIRPTPGYSTSSNSSIKLSGWIIAAQSYHKARCFSSTDVFFSCIISQPRGKYDRRNYPFWQH